MKHAERNRQIKCMSCDCNFTGRAGTWSC